MRIRWGNVADATGKEIGLSNVQTWSLEGLPLCRAPKSKRHGCITLMYTPQGDPLVERVMRAFQVGNAVRTGETLPMEELHQGTHTSQAPRQGLVGAKDEDFIYEYSLNHPGVIQFAVSFTSQTGSPSMAYNVWYNSTTVTNTTVFTGSSTGLLQDPALMRGDPNLEDPYGQRLLSILRGLDEAILTTMDPNNPAILDINLRSFPTVGERGRLAANEDMIWNYGAMLLFLPAVLLLTTTMLHLVREREAGLRIQMQVMGLSPTTYLLSHLITSFTKAFIQSLVLLTCGIACRLAFFSNTNILILFLVITLYSLAAITLGMFLGVTVPSSRMGISLVFLLVTFTLIYLLLLPGFWYTWYVDLDKTLRGGSATRGTTIGWVLGMPVPFFQFAQLYIDIIQRATGGTDPATGNYRPGPGFSFTDLGRAPLVGDRSYPDLVHAPWINLCFLLGDIFFWILITYQADRVVSRPSFSQNPSFPFHFFSWIFGGNRKKGDLPTELDEVMMTERGGNPSYPMEGRFGQLDIDVQEEMNRAKDRSNGSNYAIRIVGAQKSYKSSRTSLWTSNSETSESSGPRRALKGIYLTCEPGRVLTLLGENGAGKSTTMAILTGSLFPDAGKAYIRGMDVSQDGSIIPSILGLCPQVSAEECIALNQTVG